MYKYHKLLAAFLPLGTNFSGSKVEHLFILSLNEIAFSASTSLLLSKTYDLSLSSYDILLSTYHSSLSFLHILASTTK